MGVMMFNFFERLMSGGVSVIESLTLEITKFKTTAGVEKYRCYLPELNECYVELSPTGFKPILDNILVSRYAINLKKFFSVNEVEVGGQWSNKLLLALQSNKNADIEYFLNKREKVALHVVCKY